MPILGAAGINSSAVASAVAVIDGVHDSVMEGLGSQELDFTTATTAAGSGGPEESEGQPPTKKMYGIGFCVMLASVHVNVYYVVTCVLFVYMYM